MSIQDSAASVEFQQLKEFLDSIDQGKFTPNFIENEVTTLKAIKLLTGDDLKDEFEDSTRSKKNHS